jgi:hypothetical protein
MLLLKVMELVCWCCPRHADRQSGAGLVMLLVVMVLECGGRSRHADRESCTVPAMLLKEVLVLGR